MTTIPSIAIVVCCYNRSATDVLKRIRWLLINQPVSVKGFVVSSRHTHEFDLGDDWTGLPCDNLDFDFSAYLAGAEAVVARGFGNRPVLFLNDTLFSEHASVANFRAIWRQLGLIDELELPAIAGKADAYTTVCLQNPWSKLPLYVSTFCFLLNPPALEILRRLREFAHADDVTHEHDVNEPGWGARLPCTFRQFIKSALVYRHSAYLWYRLRHATYTPAQIRSKARCIYFEHRLSGAVAEAGCIVPSNAGPCWGLYIAFHERIFRLRRRLGRFIHWYE